MARTAVLVKFPDDLLARVEAWAKGEGLNRMEAIVSLIDLALDENGSAPAVSRPPTPKSGPRGKTELAPARPAGVTRKLDTSSAGVLDPAARRAAFLAQQKPRK